VPNAHPLQVNPGIGFLCALEGFTFVTGLPFPVYPLVGSRPVLGTRARDGLDITADQLNDFPVCRVVIAIAFEVFYQSRNEMLLVQNRTLMGTNAVFNVMVDTSKFGG